MNKKKNNLKTPSYFIKRLRDNGYETNRIFDSFPDFDPRQCLIMVNPNSHCVLITCYANKNEYGEILFEVSDGGQRIAKNIHLKTPSSEVVITFLMENNIIPENVLEGA